MTFLRRLETKYREVENHGFVAPVGPEIQYKMGPKQKGQYGANTENI